MPYVTEKTLTDVVLQRWMAVPNPRLQSGHAVVIKHVHSLRA